MISVGVRVGIRIRFRVRVSVTVRFRVRLNKIDQFVSVSLDFILPCLPLSFESFCIVLSLSSESCG